MTAPHDLRDLADLTERVAALLGQINLAPLSKSTTAVLTGSTTHLTALATWLDQAADETAQWLTDAANAGDVRRRGLQNLRAMIADPNEDQRQRVLEHAQDAREEAW